MSNDLKSATNNFTEQSKKFEIAKYYTLGDEGKAREMVSGVYKDILVVKGRFLSSSSYGAFLLFLNSEHFNLMNIYILINNSFEIADLKTSKEWIKFENHLLEIADREGFDELFVSQIEKDIKKKLTVDEVTEIVNLVKQNDLIAANYNIKKFLADSTGFQNIELITDFEKTSSLSVETFSLTSSKISPEELQKGLDKNSETQDIEIKRLNDPLKGKEVRLILNGSFIISPIKGKSLSALSIGDNIMVNITDNNSQAIDVAKACNAYGEDGQIKPISGCVVSVEHSDFFEILVVVAKGIYVKIIEEEDNIKVALDLAYKQNIPAENYEGNNFMNLFVLSIIFVVLIGLILFFVI